MHILEIPSFFPPHGGLFCLEQAKALAARGHEVRIISCVQLGISIDKAFYLKARHDYWWDEMEGIKVMHHYQRGIPKMVHLNISRWCRNIYKMYCEYVKRYGKPDVIHAHCCKSAGLAARMISEEENVPFLITEHLSSMLYKKDFGEAWTRCKWLKELMKETYQKASCVITVSDELVDDVKQFFGDSYRRQTVSNTVDTDFFAYKEREPLTQERPFRFCCIAVPNVHLKGYDVLAEAIRDIPDCELHIAGVDGDKNAVTDLFADCDNVFFHGRLNKEGIRTLLYDSDALVLATRSEVQPLVVLEAMSTGIPVVSTEAIPQSERVLGACTIVPIGDAKALHDAMIAAISRGHDYDGQMFHDAVVSLASPSVIAATLESIFEKYARE